MGIDVEKCTFENLEAFIWKTRREEVGKKSSAANCSGSFVEVWGMYMVIHSTFLTIFILP
jgi:hypothetical protein